MLVRKATNINMVEIVVLAMLLLAAAVGVVYGVLSSNWLSGAPVYLPTPQQALPFGFISGLATLF